MAEEPRRTPGTARDDQKPETAVLGDPESGPNLSNAGIEIADADIQAGTDNTRAGIAANAPDRIALDLQRSDLYISLLETIRLAQRPKIIKRADRGKEPNELYGNFSYNISFDDSRNFKTVSIIEAIAWFKHKGELSPNEATLLTSLCIDAMKRTPHRLESSEEGNKPKLRKLSDQERAIEISELTEAAASIAEREIERPNTVLSLQTQLRNASITGDFTLYVEGSERPFLEGIFHHRKAKKLDTNTALELALMCINAMIKCRIPVSLIASQVSFTYSLGLINEPELSELIGAIIADPDEAAMEIRATIAMESADEAASPVPPSFVDTRMLDGSPLVHRTIGHEHDYIFAPNPDIARVRGGSRLALLIAGILLVGGGSAIYTKLSPQGDHDNGATAGASAPSATLSPIAVGSPSMTNPARHAGEAERAAASPEGEQRVPDSVAPRPQTAKSTPPAAPRGQSSPAPTPLELIPLRPLGPKAPGTITVPVAIKPSSSSGSIKIDTNASRAKWEALGYKVGISMGLAGKIIKLTDARGNIYLVDTANLAPEKSELNATLQSAE